MLQNYTLERFLLSRSLEGRQDAPVAHASFIAGLVRCVLKYLAACCRLQELPLNSNKTWRVGYRSVFWLLGQPANSKTDQVRCVEALERAIVATILCEALTPALFCSSQRHNYTSGRDGF